MRLSTPSSRPHPATPPPRTPRTPPPRPCPPAAAATGREPPPTPSELALRLELAASTGRLDLSDCGLTEVPDAVLRIQGLEDLSLAGNALTSLPPGLGELPLLRLQLSGNELTALPPSLARCTDLEGLWVHGNALTELPTGIGALKGLRALSAAGNNLASLPPGFGDLSSCEDVALGGNLLASLPDTLAGLTSLRKLALHGNRLESLPASLGALGALAALSLQGNRLASLPPGDALRGLTALEALNLADNALVDLPGSLVGLPRLKVLTLYGNALSALPPGLLAGGGGGGSGGGSGGPAPSPLSTVWLEGNPLGVDTLVEALASPTGPTLGLDGVQAAAVAAAGGAAPINHKRIRACKRTAAAPGYWKLDVGPPGAPGAGTEPGDAVLDAAGRPATGGRALVIAFGSAPGEPNWGGLLGRIRAASSPASSSSASATDPALAAFDILYVVDPWRSWYDGGGPGFETWAAHLAAAAAPYAGRVLMLGDSMGASAALMFAGHAAAAPDAAVLAFCPQLDLASSAIRPAGAPGGAASTASWRDALRERALAGVASAVSAGAKVTVHVGSWLHDVDQAAWLGENGAPGKAGQDGAAAPPPVSASGATVRVWAVPSHRLAAALDSQGELLPLVRGAIAASMGLRSGDVRVANLL